jgi:fibronectin-binding autotransporter adhesin
MTKFIHLKLMFFFSCMLFVALTDAQTVNTWKGGTNGSWNNTSNWSRGTVPITTDIVSFDGNNIDGSNASGSITITNVPTQSIGQLILNNNATVSLQAASGGSRILTVGTSNVSGDEISVPSGCTLILASNASGVITETFTLGLGNVSGVTANIAGTLTLQPNSITSGSGATNYANSAAYTLNQLVINRGQLYQVTVAGTSASSGSGPGVISGTTTDGGATFNYVGTLYGSVYATSYNNAYSAQFGVTTITGTVNYAGVFSNLSAFNATTNSLQFNGATFNNQRRDAVFPGNGGSPTTLAPSYTNVNVSISGVQYVNSSMIIAINQFPASVNALNFNCPNVTAGSLRVTSFSNASTTLNAASIDVNMGSGGQVMLPSIGGTSTVTVSGNLTVNSGTLYFGWSGAETVTVGGTVSLPSTGSLSLNAGQVVGLSVNHFSLTGSGTFSTINTTYTPTFDVKGDFSKTAGNFSVTPSFLKLRFSGNTSQNFSTNSSLANTNLEIANTGNITQLYWATH